MKTLRELTHGMFEMLEAELEHEPRTSPSHDALAAAVSDEAKSELGLVVGYHELLLAAARHQAQMLKHGNVENWMKSGIEVARLAAEGTGDKALITELYRLYRAAKELNRTVTAADLEETPDGVREAVEAVLNAVRQDARATSDSAA